MKRMAFGPAVLVGLLVFSVCSGCVATTAPTPSPTASAASRCGIAETAKDCGGLSSLAKLAKAEQSLVIAGDLASAPQMAEIARRFEDQYGLTVSWALPGQTSESRFAVTGAAGYQGVQPDIFTLDPDSERPQQNRVAAYRVTDFEQRIPTDHRDQDGRWVDDFGGVMSVGYNATVLGEQHDVGFLSSPLKTGSLAVAGTPADSASVVHAIVMLNMMAGGGEPLAGLKYLTGQRLSAEPASIARLGSADQTAVLDWSYGQAAVTKDLRKKAISWKSLVPNGAAVTGWHGIAINAAAKHPAAARLWEEFLFSADSQNYLLGNGAMPTTYGYLLLSGGVTLKSRRSMPVFSSAPTVPSFTEINDLRAAWAPRWRKILADG